MDLHGISPRSAHPSGSPVNAQVQFTRGSAKFTDAFFKMTRYIKRDILELADNPGTAEKSYRSPERETLA
jgi:hypothetical protein